MANFTRTVNCQTQAISINRSTSTLATGVIIIQALHVYEIGIQAMLSLFRSLLATSWFSLVMTNGQPSFQ